MSIWEKVKSWEKPFQKLAWPLTLIAIVTGVVIFFISYSLARHKRMVHQLKVQVLKLQTEKKIEKIKKEKAIERLKLERLKKDATVETGKRKTIRANLDKLDKKEKKAEIELKERRREVKKDDLDKLLKKATQLTKDTL